MASTKTLALSSIAFSVCLGLSLSARAAFAAMPVQSPDQIQSPVVQAWGGCGPYGHRGPWGGCRPGGQLGAWGWRRGYYDGRWGGGCWRWWYGRWVWAC